LLSSTSNSFNFWRDGWVPEVLSFGSDPNFYIYVAPFDIFGGGYIVGEMKLGFDLDDPDFTDINTALLALRSILTYILAGWTAFKMVRVFSGMA